MFVVFQNQSPLITMVAFLVHQNGFPVNPQFSRRSQISPLSNKPPLLFRVRKLVLPPPPSLLSPSPLLNAKFFQIWSSVAGYGD